MFRGQNTFEIHGDLVACLALALFRTRTFNASRRVSDHALARAEA